MRKGVKIVIDIRENTTAGREKGYFKKAFSKLLLKHKIRYEAIGHKLGIGKDKEDHNFQIILSTLTSYRNTNKCIGIIGHMHEPWKCHRLTYLQKLMTSSHAQYYYVIHLLWNDQRKYEIKLYNHAPIWKAKVDSLSHFDFKKQAEQIKKNKLNWDLEKKITYE
eukprot:UN29186